MASSARTISLRRETTLVPITALAFSGCYLLAAQDASVLVYHAYTNKLIKTLSPRVFSTTNAGQPIHGIRVSPDGKVLLWGATAVCVLVDGWDGEREIGGVAADWVYAAGLSPEETGKGVVTTAHNDVFEFTYPPERTPGEEVRGLKFGPAISPSRPILYSATLTYLTPTTVLIAAGTVFGEIIVWKCHLDTRDCKTLYVLTGHEGSIFGVDISPPRGEDSRKRVLASCSDDRTVRLWEIETENEGGGVGEEEMRAVRETGFNSGEGQEVKGLEPLAVAMGHASRIWGVKMVTKGDDDDMVVYSFGEDATMQRWGVDLQKGRLEHEETFGLHDGKHLWAHAVMEREDGGLLIGVGGGDAKISLIEEMGVGAARRGMNSIDIKDILASTKEEASRRKTPSKRSKEIITRYDFLTEDEVVAMTSSGRILRGGVDQKADEWRVEEVKEEFVEDLGLCYAMRRVGDGSVVLGTTSGNVYLYQLGKGLSLVCEVPGRIMDLISVEGAYTTSTLDGGSQGEMDVYIQLQGNMAPWYLTIDASTGHLVRKQELGQIDDRFVGVSALKARGYTLLGSRHGWIAILQANDAGSLEYLTSIRATSQDAITSIIEVPPKSSSTEEPFYFLTTSRDGFYRIYQLIHPSNDSPPHLDLLHETTALFGPTIETATFTPSSSTSSSPPHLILSGFRSKSFVTWNETTRSELASIPCGGAHRMHCLYTPPTNPSKLRFIFTKVSQVFIYAQERMGYRSLGTGGMHGREVKAVAVSEGESKRVATGGEDTTIRLWEYDERKDGNEGEEDKGEGEGKKKEMKLMGSIKSHVTGLQRLKWYGDEYLLSSAGFEEFNIWRVRKLNALYTPLAIVNKGILDDKSPLGDLRIMDFDVSSLASSSSTTITSTSTSPSSSTTTDMLITLIFSNSTLKTYRFNESTGFIPLVQGFYTGACLLQVRHLRSGEKEGRLRILTASTDGSLCIWRGTLPREDKASEVEEWILETSRVVHQSGVKALDMVEVGDGYLVFTGGDDNSVNITHISPSSSSASSSSGEEDRGYTITSGARTASAHTASINGVAIVQKGRRRYGVSISNDQRIKLWDLNDEQGRRVRLLKDEYSGVADAGDVDLLKGGRVMLAGVGLEVWEVNV